MTDLLIMIAAIIVGSALSILAGASIFLTNKRRDKAIILALPFGAGALLAAAFFDLLPESFELGDPAGLLVWALGGFIAFFILERTAGWFHRHHDHDKEAVQNTSQNQLLVAGDLSHNIIDGIAVGAAFLVNPLTGIVTTLAVATHEIPKELGTFGMLLSRGWKVKKVILINILTAIGTIASATFVYLLGNQVSLPEAELLAITSGMFIYIAASDIIPDIHEQPKQIGTLQAAVLVAGVIVVGGIIELLGV